MARRIRNIKPDFFEDEVMATLPLGCRLFFIGLWTRCDMHGVFEWSVKVLTAAIFPHDDAIDSPQVSEWLDLLVLRGRIHHYEVHGKRWGLVLQFHKHQAISKKEKDNGTTLPMPPKQTRPRDETGTIPGTIPGTVPGTPDLGHMTYDLGRRTRDEGQPQKTQPGSLSALAPLRGASQIISEKEKNTEEIRQATQRALAMRAEMEKWEAEPDQAEAILREAQ